MKIRLYKDCLVNGKYSEVFRTQDLLKGYLNSLEKYPQNTFLEIDGVYTRLEDRLTFEPLNTIIDFSQFNYIHFKYGTSDNLKDMFAFINNIEWVNGLVIIDYTCDYWHTFLDSWSLRKSFLTRSLKTKPDYHYELPIPYTPNGEPNLILYDGTNPISLVIEIQSYDLDTASNIKSNRENFVFIVGKNETTIQNSVLGFGINEVNELVDFISYRASSKNFYKLEPTSGESWENSGYVTGEKKYFEIINLYFIPQKYLGESTNYEFSEYTIPGGTPNTFVGDLTLFKFKKDGDYIMFNREVAQYTIPPNSDGLSFGFFTSQVPYFFNGLEKYVSIVLYTTKYTFNIFMLSEHGLLDITSLFQTEQNWSTVSPEVLVQQKIQRQLDTTKGIQQIVQGVVDIGVGALQVASGYNTSLASNVLDAKVGGITDPYKYVYKKELNSLGAIRGATGVSNIVGGIFGLINGGQQIAYANYEKYKNTYKVNNLSNALYNALYGFVALNMLEVSNSEEVARTVQETGYKIDLYTNSLDLGENTTDWDYNVVKFDFVRVKGLPNNINNIIESILLNGVKIWYNSSGVEYA